MKKIFILLLGTVMLFSACKPDDNGPDTSTFIEKLTGNWSITSLEIDGASRTLSSQDQAVFSEDRTYTMTLPELSFFPDEGSWQVNETDSTLSIVDTNYRFDIDTLTESNMVLILEYDNFKADRVVYHLSFRKIINS